MCAKKYLKRDNRTEKQEDLDSDFDADGNNPQ